MMDRTWNFRTPLPGGGGSPACLGAGSFGHVAGEQGTVIAVAGIAAPRGDLWIVRL